MQPKAQLRSTGRVFDAPAQGALSVQPRLNRPGVFYPVACCATVLLCLLLANPFANSAFNDDWSYSHLALKFAETGQMNYNGWGVPTALFQSLWSSTWIRAFGFSFNLLRIATIPFSLGFVLLVYALGRKAGLSNNLALFGALVVGTSPLFLPLAASFMTEPYACFFTTLCIYAAMCTITAPNRPSATRWLLILTVSGILGGSNRQTVWAAPLVLIPYVFWIRRGDRRFSIGALAAYAICIAFLVFILCRFGPPQSPVSAVTGESLNFLLHDSPAALGVVISSLLTCALVALPALLCFTPFWGKLASAWMMACSILSGQVVIALTMALGSAGLAPFLGNIFSPSGVLGAGQDALGFRPVWPTALRICATWVVILSGAAFWRFIRRKDREHPFPVPMAVFLVFGCVYVLMLFTGALLGIAQDRYVLPIIPLLVIFFLLRLQPYARSAPAVAWTCLLVFAAYSVATTHDYYNSLRARTRAAQTLRALGIPRSWISAGFEYDGWTQLELAGRMNPPLRSDSIRANTTDQFWFWPYTTALRPEYIASYSRTPGLPRQNFASIDFSMWIPPFHRWVVVHRREELRETDSCQGHEGRPCAQ